jgi:ketosteroid isomerase-like protein
MVKKASIYVSILIATACIAAAGQRTAASSSESAIRALEERWDAANLKGDAAGLDAIFADEFIMTGADGKVRTKAEVLGELKAGNIKYDTAKTEELKIIFHGDAAVVSGRWRGKYAYRGQTVNLLERFTNFYVRRSGRWQCVASHGSAIQ